jgi:hypothetical protein
MTNTRAKKELGEDVVFDTEDVDKADIGKDEGEKEEEAEIDVDDEDLEAMSREELLQKAKEMGLNVNPDMSKEELINKIREEK